jgi:hypothetical protein
LFAEIKKMTEMKKFKIENAGKNTWMVSHREFPKFTCLFEDKRFNY